MILAWSAEAIADLVSLRTYIAQESPAAAIRVTRRIADSLHQALPDQPHIGRPGRVPGTREFVVSGTPYIVPYRVAGNEIQILRIFHGARLWPEAL